MEGGRHPLLHVLVVSLLRFFLIFLPPLFPSPLSFPPSLLPSPLSLSLTRPIEEEVMCCLVQFLKRKDIPLPSSDYVTRKANDVQSSTVTLSLTLTQLGGDSLSAMSLSNLLQEEVGVSVPAVHILKSSLFVLFQSVVTQLCPGEELPLGYLSLPCQTSCTSSIGGDDRIDWDKETDIHFLTVSSSVNKVIGGGGGGVEERDNAIVLLTGSTGFLGRFILLELLDSVKCDRVYAICRGKKGCIQYLI